MLRAEALYSRRYDQKQTKRRASLGLGLRNVHREERATAPASAAAQANGGPVLHNYRPPTKFLYFPTSKLHNIHTIFLYNN